MKSEELLAPRFEVIANYPMQNKEIGDIFETYENGVNYIINSEKFDVREYPHLFRKLNWWENRKKEDMPKRLRSMSSKDQPDFDIEKEEIYEILDWDMNGMMGFLNIENRQVCDLEIFPPEYSYLPVD